MKPMKAPRDGVTIVYLGCYNKIPYTEWLQNNRDLFLTVLGAEKSMNMVPVGTVSMSTSLFIEGVFLLGDADRRGQ
jgi:hypothetical protein